MDPNQLIPKPDTIPAPPWLMIILEQLLFLLHILIVNALFGSALIIFFRWLKNNNHDAFIELNKPIASKIPIMFALGINLGVAPLLFLQVTFGHLFYSSSVLMATYWILIIPFLIIAYYGAYIHYKKMDLRQGFAKFSIAVLILMVLYIAFMLVNNNSLMEQPEKWVKYFDNRNGTILLLSDLSIYPRFLKFVFASVAIGGLFSALLFYFKKDVTKKEEKIKQGLKIFGISTAIQMAIGFIYLFSLPEEIMLKLIGRDLLSSIILLVGIIAAIGALIFAFQGKLFATLYHLLLTMIAMIITRYLLRMMYLNDNFSLSSLQIEPQWMVFSLFIVILLIGMYTVWYMVRIGFANNSGRAE